MRENLRIFCSNVRGLINNWKNATAFNWDEFDIIAFNEVWGIKDFENVKVDGFELKTAKLRQETRGGGTAIFVRNTLVVKILTTPFVEGTIETAGIKIGNINFISIYRPPNSRKDDFVDGLSTYLDTLGGQQIILGGDLNLNMNLNTPNAWINNICNTYDLKPRISGVTRIDSGTCIDNFLSNIEGTFRISTIAIADHQAITAAIPLEDKQTTGKQKFLYRDMKESNWIIFKTKIFGLTIRGEGIEEKWKNILDDIKHSVESSFPMKQAKRDYMFSMSQGLRKSRDKKNKLLRDYKLGRTSKQAYTTYNNVYRKLIKIEQSNVFKQKLTDAGSNSRKKWSVLKNELLLSKDQENITEIIKNGNTITDINKIPEIFKEHFETCATKLAEGMPRGVDTSSIMPQGESWGFKHTTEIELIAIIKSLANKNSSGQDLLSNRMLKKEQYLFAKLLKPLINESLDEGLFPNELKTANVIPIFKKGDKNNLNNYRPISLLPVLSKVYEKVLNKQLTSVIDNGYIDENQFGFREGHSTEDATMKFVNQIEHDLSKGKHVASVYIDVSKAFDSCDHSIILSKIKRTGLNENGLKLMKSYLFNRKQQILVNGKDGGFYLINIGVGQGTVLGPTLFKIYIMDLHLHTDLFCMKFADDSSFEGSGNSRDELESKMNNELLKINTWFQNNRLTLHPDKSKYLVHSRDKLINLKLGNKNIARCGYGLQEESVCLLGLNIDENLDWKIHVKKVEKKISKGNYLLWRHGKKLNIYTKKIIYESFIRCHLLYCLTVWGGCKQVILTPLLKTIKKTWSKIGKRKMHTLNRLQKFGLILFEDELRLQELKFIWKWENKKLPNSLNELLKEKQDRLRGRRFAYLNNNPRGVHNRLTKRANTEINVVSGVMSKDTMVKRIKKKLFEEKYKFTCAARHCFICLE